MYVAGMMTGGSLACTRLTFSTASTNKPPASVTRMPIR
jgi:hypothetical protein